jgi:hypothetical protein
MRFRLLVLAAITLATGCRNSAPPALASAVPNDATAIAGIDLAALRASPLYSKLPPTVTGLAEPLHNASSMMLAWNGKDLLLLASGTFAQPPSGYTLIAPGIAAAGAPDRIQAARDQLRTGRTNAPPFPKVAGTISGAVRGEGRLPLTGNLANANNLLREAEYTTASVQLHDAVELVLTAQCPTPENAQRFEQSLRAIMTLAAAATARQPEIAALLRSVHINREDRIVKANVTTRPEALANLLRLVG